MEILFMIQNVIYLSKGLKNVESNTYWTVIGCYCSRLSLRRTRLIGLFNLLCLTMFLVHILLCCQYAAVKISITSVDCGHFW